MKTFSRTPVLFAISAGAALSVGLSGCSSDGSTTDATGKVVLYTWASGSESQWDTFVDAAQTQLDGITLSYEGPSYSDYWTQINTRYSGGDAPCIVATQSDKTGTISDILAPLDDEIADAGIKTSDFNSAMIDGMTIDGEVKALPYDSSTLVLYYNKSLFSKYGVAEPGTTFTTDQFKQAAAALTADGNHGFAYSSLFYFFSPFAIAAGDSWATDDGKLDLANPDLEATLQDYLDLAADGYAEPLTAGETATQEDAFSQGNVGMIVGGTWDYSTLVDALGADNVGVAAVPSPDGTGPQLVSGSGYGISASCPDKDEAFTALAALTSEKTMQVAADSIGTVPARTAVLDTFLAKQDTAYANVVKSSLANSKVAPSIDNWSAADTLLTQYLPEGFSGDKSAKEILELVQSSAGE